jgi:hypothetical protein
VKLALIIAGWLALSFLFTVGIGRFIRHGSRA